MKKRMLFGFAAGCFTGAILFFASVCLGAVEGFQPDQPGEIRHPDALQPTPTVVTDHTRWACDNTGGTTKVLFIAPRGVLREVIELAQRMDLDYRVVALDRDTALSATADGAARLIWGSRRKPEVVADLTEALRQNYDVIVIGHVVPEVLPAEAWAAIAAHVRRGGGLIVCPPKAEVKGKPPLDSLLASAQAVPFPDAIAAAFPANLRQTMFKNWTDGKTAPFEAFTLDAGRVLLGRFTPGPHAMITPGLSLEQHLSSPCLFDYQQAVAVRALLWTAKRLASEGMSGATAEAEVNGESARIMVTPPSGKAPEIKWIELNVRKKDNRCTYHAILPAGQVRFEVPTQDLPVGEHFADVWFRDALHRIVDWRTLMLTVADTQGIVTAVATPDFVAPGAPVTAIITLKEPLRQNERLELSVSDFHGRVAARETVRSASGTNLTATLMVGKPLSILCDLRVELWRDVRLVDLSHAEIAIEQPAGGAGWDDFSWMYWCFQDEVIADMSLRQLLPYGLDRVMVERGKVEWQVRGAALIARAYDAKAFPYAWELRLPQPYQIDPKSLIGKFKPLAEQLKRYGCDTIDMGDENMLGEPHAQFENRMEPAFPEAMKIRYGTLEALNAAWGCAFEKWEDVKGIDYDKARQSFQHTRFLDTRRYLDDLFARFHGLGRETAREVSPQYRVGFEGAFNTVWSNGYDWSKLMNNIDLMGHYWFTPAEIYLARSFKPDNAYWGFWNGAYMDVHNRWIQGWIAWRSLFWGMNSVWWWCPLPGAGGGDGGPFHILYPDLRIDPEVLPFLESVREIKAGPGKLLLGAKRSDYGIGIHYSQASLYADALDNYGFKALGAGVSSRIQDAWLNFIFGLGDAGLQYRFVSYAQVEKGDFGNLRVMILPFSQAISRKEAESLRAFVERGGLLIADIRPGVFDDLGRPVNPGMLDDLFGIRRPTEVREKMGYIGDSQDLALNFESDGKNLALELPHTQVDRAVALSGGRTRASAGEVPLLVERSLGKGRTVLLNFATDYTVAPYGSPAVKRVRGSGRDDAWVSLLRTLMTEAGVRPELTLTSGGERLRGVETVTWHDGSARYYGFTVADFTDFALVCTGPARSVTGTLDCVGHVYDVREGKYLGEGASFACTLPRGGAMLIAVLPYKVDAVEAKPPTGAKLGEEVTIPFSIKATAELGRHVLRVRAFDPNGRERSEYASNVEAPAGKGIYRLPLALSDSVGAWTVVARDVASGVEQSLKLDIH